MNTAKFVAILSWINVYAILWAAMLLPQFGEQTGRWIAMLLLTVLIAAIATSAERKS